MTADSRQTQTAATERLNDLVAHHLRWQSWQPIETAPKNGTEIWCWLYDAGIHLMRWMSAADNAARDGGDDPEGFISCWVKSSDQSDGDWKPKFWLPREAICIPPNVVLVRDGWDARWRDDC